MVLALKAISALLALAPLGVAQALGRGFGWLFGNVVRFRQSYIEETLRLAFPERSEPERRRILRGFYAHFGMLCAELLRLPSISGREIDRLIVIEGKEHVDAAAARGKGVLVLMGHVGNWELMGVACARMGYSTHAVVKRVRDRGADAYLRRTRERLGIRLLVANESHRECLRVLREGGNVGVALDQNVKREQGVFVSFFGRPACTTPGLAVLALQSGAPVVPGYVLRQPDGTHHVHFLPALDPPTGRSAEALREATQRYTHVLEEIIHRHPEQWLWVHHRWRTRPPDEAVHRSAGACRKHRRAG